MIAASIRAVARDEWRCWQRTRLAWAGALLMAALLLAATVLTAQRMQQERAERRQHQAQAEAAFLGQPDRHPHRMVHYGHYAFRTPAPLALIDPGVDPVTGQSIFLEGHRQNTAMFPPGGASADLGAFSALSPALVLQLFGPLLLILLGHGALAREREAGTLAALLALGLPGRRLLAGKALALGGVVVAMLLPLAAGGALALGQGEGLAAVAGLVGVYLLYLAAWAALVLLASALLRSRAAVLAALLALWVGLTLVLPSVAVSVAAAVAPLPGKVETDLRMLADLRRLGDGHNANDPAFAQLRADLLARHGVQRVEDLPVNLRGVVAQVGEQRLTETLDTYARRQREAERHQGRVLAWQGLAVPALAVAEASRAVAGTDLRHHHRFLVEAEALRYAFVQGLNRVHAEHLSYADDIRRSSDAEAERRTRVDASHWQLLQRFDFRPDAPRTRLAQALAPAGMLALWCAALALALARAGARLTP